MIFLKNIKKYSFKKLFKFILNIISKLKGIDLKKINLKNINRDKIKEFYAKFKEKKNFKKILIISALSLTIGSTLVVVNANSLKNNDNSIKEILEKKVIIRRNLKKTDNLIKIYDHRQKKLIELPLEEYLYGVVSGEIGSDFNEEAIKAQSVAARTFTANIIVNKTKNHTSGAHVCTDFTHCQEYKPDNITDKIKNAVDATKGEILTYNDSPINALYFSSSGGKTENAKDVWGNEYPYLISVDSTYDEKVVNIKSSTKFTQLQLTSKLGVTFTEEDLSKQIKILSRTEGGSVKKVKIGSSTFSGVDIRTKLGLKSANFDISINNNTIIFSVKGFGHGVGLSQYGAHSMGKEGFKYVDILKHYYSNVELINLY